MGMYKRDVTHSRKCVEKIQTSKLVKRLQDHFLADLSDTEAFKKNNLTSSQLKAGEMLLERVLPKLSSVEVASDPDNPFEANVNGTLKLDEETKQFIIDSILKDI